MFKDDRKKVSGTVETEKDAYLRVLKYLSKISS